MQITYSQGIMVICIFDDLIKKIQKMIELTIFSQPRSAAACDRFCTKGFVKKKAAASGRTPKRFAHRRYCCFYCQGI